MADVAAATLFYEALGFHKSSASQDTISFWGGPSSYLADPDGHLWELAHNPYLPLDDDGSPQLPD